MRLIRQIIRTVGKHNRHSRQIPVTRPTVIQLNKLSVINAALISIHLIDHHIRHDNIRAVILSTWRGSNLGVGVGVALTTRTVRATLIQHPPH